MCYFNERLEGFCAIRRRKRGSVTQEHISYNGKIIGRMGVLFSSQYRRVKNQKKWDRVMQCIYPALHDMGKAFGCRVEMSLNMEELVASVLYKGKSFFLMDEEIADILLPAETIRLVAEDGDFWLCLTYELCDKVLIDDRAERIQALRFCLDASGVPKVEQ